jgi:hypothetical protein
MMDTLVDAHTPGKTRVVLDHDKLESLSEGHELSFSLYSLSQELPEWAPKLEHQWGTC